MPATAASTAAASRAPCLHSPLHTQLPARPADPCTHASLSPFSVVVSSLSSSSPPSSLAPPLHLLALAALVLLGCPIPAACDPASGPSNAAITAALLSSSSLQHQQLQHQHQQQQGPHQSQQQQQQHSHPKGLHLPFQDRHQKRIQLQEPHGRNQRRRLTESTGHRGSGRDNGRIWLMQGRSLTANDDSTGTGATFASSFSSESRLSNLSTTETTLAGLLGVVLALAVLGVCICIVKKRRRASSWSTSRYEPPTPAPSQPQQPAVPLYQPPETASALSSFTRVSAAGPEMSSVLATAGARSGAYPYNLRSPSTSAVAGFSLARLFVRQPRERGAGESGKSVYMHQKDPLEDWRSQKTSSPVSTRSSSHDYCWGDLQSKEYTKDGFPVITLTSPTNSESSIPIPIPIPVAATGRSASSSTGSTSSNPMPLSEQSTSGLYVVSQTAALKDMDRDSTTPSIYAADHQNLYISRPSVPQHMLLHPSSTYSRLPRSEKQTLATPSLTDFPPTYEEAVDDSGVSSKTTEDDQSSSSSSPSSGSNSSNSSNRIAEGGSPHSNRGSSKVLSMNEMGPPTASLLPTTGSYSSCPGMLSAESMDWANYRNRTEWNAEYGVEGCPGTQHGSRIVAVSNRVECVECVVRGVSFPHLRHPHPPIKLKAPSHFVLNPPTSRQPAQRSTLL
ncbi:unnamed protein product [Mortierella alpina]